MEHVVFIITLTLITFSAYPLILLWQKFAVRREVLYDTSLAIQTGDQLYIKRHIILDKVIHGGLVTVNTTKHNCLVLKEIDNHNFPITSPLLANQKKLAKRYGQRKASLTPSKLLFF